MASRRHLLSWTRFGASRHTACLLGAVGVLATAGLLLGPVSGTVAATKGPSRTGDGQWGASAGAGTLPPAPTSASGTGGGSTTTKPGPGASATTLTTLIGQALSSPSSTAGGAPLVRPSCGGSQTVVDAAGTWNCSFDDEFQGTTLDPTKWQVVTTQADGFRSGIYTCYVNSPNNISVANGYLTLTVRKETSPFVCAANASGNYVTQFSGGDIASYQRFSQTYARVEFLAAVPPIGTNPGTHSALWLYPESQKQTGSNPGEIDVAEMYSNYPDMAYPYLHYPYSQGSTNTQTNTNTVTANNCHVGPGFNDYVLEWTPKAITMTYNGQLCLIDHWMPSSPFAYPEPFDQPFFLNLTEGLANYTGAASNAPATASMKVDYVRVWQLTK